MKAEPETYFKRNYKAHLKHLRLKVIQPKTFKVYAWAGLNGKAVGRRMQVAITPRPLSINHAATGTGRRLGDDPGDSD